MLGSQMVGFSPMAPWRYDLMEGDKLSNKAAPRIDAPWDDLAGNIGAMKSMVFTLKARNQCFFF